MKTTLQNPIYGEIVYEESFLSGKKDITINGVKLTKINKTTFSYKTEAEEKTVTVKGGYLGTVKMTIDNQVITLVAYSKWYEFLCVALSFGAIYGLIQASHYINYDNSVILGGVSAGLCAGVGVTTLAFMKTAPTLLKKLLIWAGFSAVTAGICFGLAAALQ